MNCVEFHETLPDVTDNSRTAEQEIHLTSCPACSNLMADLALIASEARQLQSVAEPSSRVWNSIEIALRQEGLIRDSRPGPSLVPSVPRRWNMGWLAPVAAVLLVGFGILVYQRGSGPAKPVAQLSSDVPATVARLETGKNPLPVNNAKSEDDQLLAAVASRSPAMQAQYASNLQNVNAYIRDAEESAHADPNDEEAQQIVMDAYGQREAVYEMALDRSMQ